MMNPFINPLFLSKIFATYLIDLKRLHNLDKKDLEKFQDKIFKNIVKYAYTIPMYNEKYKKSGIHPSSIKSIKDIIKLPFITRNDLVENYPNKVISASFKKKNSIISYTSGTTGKPVAIFFDMYGTLKALFGYVRVIKEHNARWIKNKITIIVDLSRNSIESEYLTHWVLPSLKPFFGFDNIQIFNTYDKAENIVKKIDRFQPEFIIGYPGMLRHLAILKKEGVGKNIQPKKIFSCGSVLGKSLKHFLEKTFETEIFDVYGAMETGPIAFQCTKGKYHIHSDLVNVEILDKNGINIKSETPGKTVVTRLYGYGTPIIRYTGLDDIITPLLDTCDCGINSKLIKKIHGREKHSIIINDKKILLPSTIDDFFGEVSNEINIESIKRFQIIQYKIDEIEIISGVNKNISDPRFVKIMQIIKKKFKEKYGIAISVSVKDETYFKPHTPGIIQKVDLTKINNKQYI